MSDTFTRYRTDDPETSRIAIEEIDEAALRRMQIEVLAFIIKEGPCTLLDVENYFHDHGSSYRTRVSELVEKGLVRDSGKKVRQRGPGSKRATLRIVWELVR